MAENDKILDVKNLRVSFKTDSGTVKAVRGISFSLYRGKTLAIVGESGSGKSVTSKAILGILANNKIVEDGQIIYDGKDLLKISEEQFTKLRGVKISMIFQDPLSSLNPIMIVGDQLTEAMRLKNKADRHEAKKLLGKLNAAMLKANKAEAEAFIKAIKEGHSIETKTLFEDSVKSSFARQQEAINAVLPSLIEARKKAEGEFDIDPICKELSKHFKELDNCTFDMALYADNDIAVAHTIIKGVQKDAKLASKMEAKRKADMEKYQAGTLYDLPPAIRAKAREVIRTQNEYRDELRHCLDTVINRLNAILATSDEALNAMAYAARDAYLKAVETEKKVLTKQEAKEKAIKMLSDVGIAEAERRYKQYPFELSGGMRQRIVIAIALCSSPEVLICDEPTTALDVTIQSQILELINKLKAERNLSIVFITHDLGVVANMADDIAVMYAGKIVEYGTAKDIFYDPRHPYTWALLGSVPDLTTKEKLNSIPGTPPNMLLPPRGDAFALRNSNALDIDSILPPPFYQVSSTHFAATWNLDEKAPDLEAPEVVKARIEGALKAHPESRPVYDNPKNSILEQLGAKKAPKKAKKEVNEDGK